MRTSITSIARVFNFAIFPKNYKICVCVCVCARVCISACVDKCDKSKQCYSCHMENTTLRIILRNVTKFRKFINWKFKTLITYTRRKTSPDWNVVTTSPSIKILYTLKQSWKHVLKCLLYAFLLSFTSFMAGGDIRSYKLKQTCS